MPAPRGKLNSKQLGEVAEFLQGTCQTLSEAMKVCGYDGYDEEDAESSIDCRGRHLPLRGVWVVVVREFRGPREPGRQRRMRRLPHWIAIEFCELRRWWTLMLLSYVVLCYLPEQAV